MSKYHILKTIEVVTMAGVVAGSIAGIAAAINAGNSAKKDVSDMLSSPEVIEYIQDDLSVLNNKFNEGSVDYDAYRQQVNTLKENAAKEVFGGKYETAKKNINKRFLAFVPTPTLALGATTILYDFLVHDGKDSFLSLLSDELEQRRELKKYQKSQKAKKEETPEPENV